MKIKPLKLQALNLGHTCICSKVKKRVCAGSKFHRDSVYACNEKIYTGKHIG